MKSKKHIPSLFFKKENSKSVITTGATSTNSNGHGRTIIQKGGLLLLLFLALSCATIPFTGRKQFILIPGGALASLADSWYRETLGEYNLSSNAEQIETLNNVGKRLAEAAEEYMRTHGFASEISNYSWEFNLIESKEVNAWAMPGGKIAFYTGILDIMDSEDEIAVVMSHEIAHVIARHGAERLTQSLMLSFGLMGLDKLLEEKPEETRNVFLAAVGVGSHIGVLLPFSRKHEYEADEIGLELMSIAGYELDAAVTFWQKMMDLSDSSFPEFLSTHPASRNRVRNMRKIINNIRSS